MLAVGQVSLLRKFGMYPNNLLGEQFVEKKLRKVHLNLVNI